MQSHAFTPYASIALSLEEQAQRGEALLETLRGRRSVRHFSTTPVPQALIELAVRAASTAPSGANLEPWHFVAVGDPALKARIREGAEIEERENYAGRMSDAWLEDLAKLGTDANKPMLEDAPWLIAVFREVSRPDGSRNYYTQESVGIAVGMLLAALQTMGLASLTHTPSPMRFLSEILGRPKHEKPFLLIPVGYPAQGCMVPDLQKKPLDAVLTVLNGETPAMERA